MDSPTVSIITPVYNAARFLPRLFECVENQQGITIEHILIDDSSSDASLQVMRRLARGRSWIKIITLTTNRGPVVARNAGIREARGKYLAFLDADDYWLPNKALVQSQFMDKQCVALSFSDYRFISEDGRLIGRQLRGFERIGWSTHHMTRYLGCLTIMINREICKDFFFPDISPSYRAEDFLAWSAIILKYGPALRCKHDLARYSVVDNSRSSRPLRAAISVWKLYRQVENIAVLEASWYFSIYAILTTVKRLFHRPIWPAQLVDGDLASHYLLKRFDNPTQV